MTGKKLLSVNMLQTNQRRCASTGILSRIIFLTAGMPQIILTGLLCPMSQFKQYKPFSRSADPPESSGWDLPIVSLRIPVPRHQFLGLQDTGTSCICLRCNCIKGLVTTCSFHHACNCRPVVQRSLSLSKPASTREHNRSMFEACNNSEHCKPLQPSGRRRRICLVSLWLSQSVLVVFLRNWAVSELGRGKDWTLGGLQRLQPATQLGTSRSINNSKAILQTESSVVDQQWNHTTGPLMSFLT